MLAKAKINLLAIGEMYPKGVGDWLLRQGIPANDAFVGDEDRFGGAFTRNNESTICSQTCRHSRRGCPHELRE